MSHLTPSLKCSQVVSQTLRSRALLWGQWRDTAYVRVGMRREEWGRGQEREKNHTFSIHFIPGLRIQRGSAEAEAVTDALVVTSRGGRCLALAVAEVRLGEAGSLAQEPQWAAKQTCPFCLNTCVEHQWVNRGPSSFYGRIAKLYLGFGMSS